MNLSTRPAGAPLDATPRFPTWHKVVSVLANSTRRMPGFTRPVQALAPLVAGLVMLATSAFAQGHPPGFGLEDVTAKAKALSNAPYAAPASNLPDVFSKMQFFDYQKMQPRRDRFAWADLDTPFKLSFYHQGMQFNTPVRISEIVGGEAHEVPYDPDRFDFGDLHFDRDQTSRLGWAGFRVMYPVNEPGKNDEIMSVLGASYFRVIGKGQIYGLS